MLIIVPASLRLVWAEEIERWLPHIRPGEVTVIEGKDDRSAAAATKQHRTSNALCLPHCPVCGSSQPTQAQQHHRFVNLRRLSL